MLGFKRPGIDLATFVGGIVRALTKGQQALPKSRREQLEKHFKKDDNGIYHPIVSVFQINEQQQVTVPNYALSRVNNIGIDSAVIRCSAKIVELDVEISQSAEFKDHIDAGGEGEGKIGWGPFSVPLKAKASYSKDNTRKTDTRAKQHVEINVGQCPVPEGFSLILERFRNNALEAPAPDNPYVPGNIKPAIPAPDAV